MNIKIKKSIFLLLLVIGISLNSQAQFIVGYDQQYHMQLLKDFAERVGADAILNKYQDSIAQSKTRTNNYLTVVSGIQQTLYNSLTTASDLITQGKSIPYLGKVATDIYNYQAKMISEATQYPLYLPFAEKYEFQLVSRVTDLILYIGDIVTTSDTKTVLDRAKRDEMYHHIQDELMIIRGLSYSAWQSIASAKKVGLVKSLNPWQKYINNDINLFKQVDNSLKFPY